MSEPNDVQKDGLNINVKVGNLEGKIQFEGEAIFTFHGGYETNINPKQLLKLGEHMQNLSGKIDAVKDFLRKIKPSQN